MLLESLINGGSMVTMIGSPWASRYHEVTATGIAKGAVDPCNTIFSINYYFEKLTNTA